MSDTIQAYDLIGDASMRPTVDGDYVKSADHERELAAKDAELTQLKTITGLAKDEIVKQDATIEKLRAALVLANRLIKNEYLPWAYAGGPNECTHGRADGIPCLFCDDLTFRQTLTETCHEM